MEKAKQLVHEALNQFPAAIPWFVGIYDDWTIGHLKRNSITGRIELHSENFSNTNFQLICKFISVNIQREILPENLLDYANYNGEIGRLVVKQFIKAVNDLANEKTYINQNSLDLIGKAVIDDTATPLSTKTKATGLIRGSSDISISAKVRVAILQRDGHACVFCGRTSRQGELKIDLIDHSISNKFTNLSNLQTLCVECYSGKND